MKILSESNIIPFSETIWVSDEINCSVNRLAEGPTGSVKSSIIKSNNFLSIIAVSTNDAASSISSETRGSL